MVMIKRYRYYNSYTNVVMALSLSRIHQLKTINNTCVRVCRCTGNVYPYRGERIIERAAIPIKHSSQLTVTTRSQI